MENIEPDFDALLEEKNINELNELHKLKMLRLKYELYRILSTFKTVFY